LINNTILFLVLQRVAKSAQMVIKSAVTAYLVILEQDVNLAMLVFMVVLKRQVNTYFLCLNFLLKLTNPCGKARAVFWC